MRMVLQAGDVANVAEDLAAALHDHTDWRSTPVAVAGLRRRSKLGRVAELPERAVRTRREVARAIAASRPDIVHLHWARYAPFVDTGGVPLVVHVHGSDMRSRGSTLTGKLVHRAMSKAGAVLVSTPDLLEHAPESARYLPNPVDIDLFSPGPRNDESVSQRPTVLLFARLLPVKGADKLIETARRLLDADPNVRVVALAGGELDAAAAAAGVELLPARPRADLVPLLRSVDVVVGQQKLGILSLSELEAMACERPVIVPLRDGYYPSTVSALDTADPEEVARRCLDLIGDPAAAREAGLRGRAYVSEHHAPKVVADLLTGIYEATTR